MPITSSVWVSISGERLGIEVGEGPGVEVGEGLGIGVGVAVGRAVGSGMGVGVGAAVSEGVLVDMGVGGGGLDVPQPRVAAIRTRKVPNTYVSFPTVFTNKPPFASP